MGGAGVCNTLSVYFMKYSNKNNIHYLITKDVGLPRTEKKKNGNKGDLFKTYSVIGKNNSLKTAESITAHYVGMLVIHLSAESITAHYVGMLVIHLSVFRLLLVFCEE